MQYLHRSLGGLLFGGLLFGGRLFGGLAIFSRGARAALSGSPFLIPVFAISLPLPLDGTNVLDLHATSSAPLGEVSVLGRSAERKISRTVRHRASLCLPRAESPLILPSPLPPIHLNCCSHKSGDSLTLLLQSARMQRLENKHRDRSWKMRRCRPINYCKHAKGWGVGNLSWE